MSPAAVTFWAYAALGIVLVIAIVFAFVFGPQAIREWKSITASTDDPAPAVVQAEVISYGHPGERQRLRGLIEIQRSTSENVVYADFDARRRLAAKLAFDEIELDLDSEAVN